MNWGFPLPSLRNALLYWWPKRSPHQKNAVCLIVTQWGYWNFLPMVEENKLICLSRVITDHLYAWFFSEQWRTQYYFFTICVIRTICIKHLLCIRQYARYLIRGDEQNRYSPCPIWAINMNYILLYIIVRIKILWKYFMKVYETWK